MSISDTGGSQEWMPAVEALFSDVEHWAREWLTVSGWTPLHGWDVVRQEKEIMDDFSQAKHIVPTLHVNARPQEITSGREVQLILEPITFNPSTGMIRVDFYVWPAMYRVRLLHEAKYDNWIVKTDSGLNWPLPWNEATFRQIAEGLLDA